MADDVILVLTQQIDPHADFVVEELSRRGEPVVRFDTAEFPQRSVLRAENASSGWGGEISLESGRTIPIGRIRSIWYRRPTPFEFPASLAPGNRNFTHREAHMAFGGLLRSENCLWVNHPEKRERRAQAVSTCSCGAAWSGSSAHADDEFSKGCVRVL